METKRSKKPIIIGIVLVLVIIAVVLIILFSKKKEVYRTIKVNSMEGTASLTRGGETIDVVNEMSLFSGDRAAVHNDSLLDLLADADKHIVAKENTTFSIQATGSESNGSIIISVEKGDALFTIDNKLPENSTFEVQTPNASISVRGTTFEVSYDPAIRQTHVLVTEGVVNVATNIEEATLNAGEEVYVVDDAITTSAADAGTNAGASGSGDVDTSDASEGMLEYGDIVILSAAVAHADGSGFGGLPSTREAYNNVLMGVLGTYNSADALYAYVAEYAGGDEEVIEVTGMPAEEYKLHLAEVMVTVADNGGITEAEYEMILSYIEDSKRASDTQLCDTVRTAVTIALMDPEVTTNPNAEIPKPGTHNLTDIYSYAVFGDVVAECIGAPDAASVEAQLKSSKAAGGPIYVVIEAATEFDGYIVAVYCGWDDTINAGM
ncbi:MAG: FecR family protein [Lachnospiraceae bacterium]|nr:FecR family protein [Lachnospiraceae bacterium]